MHVSFGFRHAASVRRTCQTLARLQGGDSMGPDRLLEFSSLSVSLIRRSSFSQFVFLACLFSLLFFIVSCFFFLSSFLSFSLSFFLFKDLLSPRTSKDAFFS